jgi:hypothetical protein
MNTNREPRSQKGERQSAFLTRPQQLGLLIILFVFIVYVLIRVRG